MAAQAAPYRATIDRYLTPATKEEITLILTKLAAHYPLQEKPAALVKEQFKDWHGDFADVPAWMLEEATTKWRRSESWFPRTADLLALIRPTLSDLRSSRHYCDLVVRLAGEQDVRCAPEIERPSPAQARAIMRRLGMGADRKPRPPLRLVDS